MEITGWDRGCEQQSAKSWLEKGEAALCGGNHSEAAGCFGRALKADPFNARAYTRLSSVYWAQGKTEDALNSLTRALELEPGDRETVLECVRIFKAFGREDFAKEVVQSYLGRNPYDAEIRSRLDSLAQHADRGQSPDAAEFFNRKGEIHFERGNIPHSTACFEMAIEENPMMAEAHNNLGVIYLKNGKVTEALEKFDRALDLKPEDAEILVNSARGLARAGHTDTAINVYREYLRRSPKDNTAWEEFESLVRQSAAPVWSPEGLSSDVADIYLHTAEALENAGDLRGASEAIERALKMKPSAPDALYVLASLHSAIGQKDEAKSILDRALTIDPSHAPSSEMRKSLRNGNGAKAV